MASLVKKCRHDRLDWHTCGCAWYVRQRSGGRDHYTPVGNDRDAAKRALARLTSSADETVSKALDQWLTSKRRGGVRPGSLISFESRAARVRAYFVHDTLRGLRDDDLTSFAQDLLSEGYAPASAQSIYLCLTATLRHAQRRGVIRHLPLPPGGPGIPTPQPRVHQLTLGQVEVVIARMDGVWGLVAELVLLTGLRFGEAVSIRPEDVEGRVLHVRRTRNPSGATNPPKTRSGARIVPLSPKAVKILAELDLPVKGEYRRAREELVKALGPLHQPGMGWHALRAAHATLLDQAGVSLRDSAARMGHGHAFAQTLAYGVRSEAGSAARLDRARKRHVAPSAEPSAPASIAEARARRRRAP